MSTELSVVGGCVLSTTPSQSSGTNDTQVVHLMAHLTRETGVVGSQVYTRKVLGRWYFAVGSSVHTRPRAMAVGTQVSPNFLDLTLSLAISLGMISR